MTTPVRRRRAESSFRIHEDVPSTEDTQVNDDAMDVQDDQDEYDEDDDRDDMHRRGDADDQESDVSESSAEDAVDMNVTVDMMKLQDSFPGFTRKYRLIKRIGEGTFSTVYKAEDLQYDNFDNTWDLEKENEKWSTPPLKPFQNRTEQGEQQVRHALRQQQQEQQCRRKPRFVAIKKIYVTSSPHRILNELELLHDLRSCPSVCPLITAFRQTDQVIAILPYFRHADFREYYRNMSPTDTAIYLRSLFTALSAVHAHGILHRDIKPTNFLYDPPTRRGVLVDFGLAEREGFDSKPCLCHEDSSVRKSRLRPALHALSGPHSGYPKNDTRPSRRANRAGTRGFRAPEVLFKCTEQTTKIDIWSAGVILLTIMSRRFPFFNSVDDVEAMIEIATIFGQKRMRAAGQLHGCMFETNIPTISIGGFSLEKIIIWSTCRVDTGESLSDDEMVALDFLNACLELDPSRRINADDALDHPFLRMGMEAHESVDAGDDDEMDILRV